MTESHGERTHDPGHTVRLGLPEQVCDWLCKLALFSITALIGVGVFSRTFLPVTIQNTDEIGGYLLVALSFVSLPVCQAYRGFHEVKLVQSRLTEGGRLLLQTALDLLSLGFCVVLVWQFGAFEIKSWEYGETSVTSLQMPLWIPRLTMLLGVVVLCWSLAKSLGGHVRKLSLRARRRRTP